VYIHIPENTDNGDNNLFTNISSKLLKICFGGSSYEVFHEGISYWKTFTPNLTLVGGAGNTVPVYTTNSGRYLQIGKLVYVDVILDGDGGAEGAGTGVVNIALPITAGASKLNGDLEYPVGTGANGSGPEILTGSIAQSGTTIALQRQFEIRSIPNLKGVDQNNSARSIRLHFWYEID
jgi:hypothetical protein